MEEKNGWKQTLLNYEDDPDILKEEFVALINISF